jgi:hypothetical protein
LTSVDCKEQKHACVVLLGREAQGQLLMSMLPVVQRQQRCASKNAWVQPASALTSSPNLRSGVQYLQYVMCAWRLVCRALCHSHSQPAAARSVAFVSMHMSG